MSETKQVKILYTVMLFEKGKSPTTIYKSYDSSASQYVYEKMFEKIYIKWCMSDEMGVEIIRDSDPK